MSRLVPPPLSRRTVLRGAGGVAIALPFLDAMTPRRAHGQPAPAFPKRFVVMFNGNGTFAEDWKPAGTGTAFSLSNILMPLEPYKSDLNIVFGLDNEAAKKGPGNNGHDKGMGCMLTATELVAGPSGVGQFGHLWDGSAGGISIDQEIAKTIGGKTKFRSLEFGVQGGGARQAVINWMSYLGPFQVVPAENRPDLAFARIFADVGADPAALAAQRARRKSVLDSVLGDLGEVRTRVGTADRQKLDAHAAAIRQIETRLLAQPAAGGACQKPTLPATLPRDVPTIGGLQLDLLVAALTCDLARVGSIQWGRAQSNINHTWLGIPEDHHTLSHAGDSDAAAKDKLVRIQKWYAEQFAGLLRRLKAVTEGPGTMLDNTLVVWVNELGRGNSHTPNDIPIVLAGKAGGALRTGRYLTFTTTPINNLYVALANLMDVPIKTFGNPAYSTGPLAGLL